MLAYSIRITGKQTTTAQFFLDGKIMLLIIFLFFSEESILLLVFDMIDSEIVKRLLLGGVWQMVSSARFPKNMIRIVFLCAEKEKKKVCSFLSY